MDQANNVILNLNGIPTNSPPNDVVYFSPDPQGAWLPSKGLMLAQIEAKCLQLHDLFPKRIFGSLSTYYSLLPRVAELAFYGGLNSESSVSRKEFEAIAQNVRNDESSNKLLYLYDCRKLVGSIQECTKEVSYLMGELYRSFNLDTLLFPIISEPDGLRWVTSPAVTKIHAILAFIFVRLHSLLDYMTKLAYELQFLKLEFTSYPKLSSSTVQFGDRKTLALNQTPNTLFESSDLIIEIETIRNLVIHDGLLDDMPKIYKVIRNGQTVEKFILLPDRGQSGRFEKYINRNLFFSCEDKINLRLPDVVGDFQQKLYVTLSALV